MGIVKIAAYKGLSIFIRDEKTLPMGTWISCGTCPHLNIHNIKINMVCVVYNMFSAVNYWLLTIWNHQHSRDFKNPGNNFVYSWPCAVHDNIHKLKCLILRTFRLLLNNKQLWFCVGSPLICIWAKPIESPCFKLNKRPKTVD